MATSMESLEHKHGHRIMVIAAILTIIGAIFWLRSRAAASSSSPSGTLPNPTGAPGTPTGPDNNTLQGLLDQLHTLQTQVAAGPTGADLAFDFGYNNTTQNQAARGKGGGGSSGLSLGFGGFSLGFGGSHSSSDQTAYASTQNDVFHTSVTGHNLTQDEINGLEQFLLGAGGSYQQRQDANAARAGANQTQSDHLLGNAVAPPVHH